MKNYVFTSSYCCALILLTAGSAQTPASAGPLARWAVVPGADATRAVADLLTADLSSEAGLTLVERAEVDRVFAEQQLDAVLSAAGTADRLRLGQLLKADALLILSPDEADAARLRVVVCDTATGARLHFEQVESVAARPQDAIDRMRGVVREIRERHPDGVKQLIGVPHFVSRSLSHRYDACQARFAYVLETACGALPGTAVIEIEEARQIQRELDLAGGDVRGRVVPLFLEGEFRAETDEADDVVPVVVRVGATDGKQERVRTERRCIGLKAAVEFLQHEATATLLQLPPGERLTPAAQLERMKARAESFSTLGAYDHAIGLLEACLLLEPTEPQLAVRLIAEYRRVVAGTGATSDVQYRAFMRDKDRWRARLDYWRRGLALVERLVRAGRVTQHEALAALADVQGGIHDFTFFMPKEQTNTFYPIEKELLDAIIVELTECSRLHRASQLDVLPLVPQLRVGVPPSGPHFGRQDSAQGSWLTAAEFYPEYERIEHDDRITAAQIAHVERVLNAYPDDSLGIPRKLLGIMSGVGLNPDFQRSFTDDEYRALLAGLKASSKPSLGIAGQLGEALFAHCCGPAEQRASVTTTLSRVRSLAREYRALMSLAADPAAFTHAIETLEQEEERSAGRTRPPASAPARNETPATAPSAAMSSTPRRSHSSAPDAPALRPLDGDGRLKIDRVTMQVRRRDGGMMTLEELPWADYGGYVARGGYPCQIEPSTSGFDALWNRWTVWVHREPGVLDELFTDQGVDVRDVACDGDKIWVATARDGLTVYSPDGRTVASIGSAQNLPDWDWALELEPIGPGCMFVAGTFGDLERSWCAIVTLDAANSARVELIHEAKEPYNASEEFRRESENRRAGRSARAADDARNDPARGFKVCCVQKYRPALAGGAWRYLVNRIEREWRPLAVELEPRRVAVEHLNAHGRTPLNSGHFAYLRNGDRLMSYSNAIEVITQRGSLNEHGQLRRVVLAPQGNRFFGVPFELNGYWYCPGERWSRFSPETFVVEDLGPGPFIRSESESGFFAGPSSHFEILAFDKRGKFYAISPAADSPGGASTSMSQFTVVVSDQDTGQPVAGAVLELRSLPATATATTDQDGRGTVKLAGQATPSASLYVARPGYVARQLTVTPARLAAESGQLAVPLQPAWRIGGMVQNKEGAPLAGATVELAIAPPNTVVSSADYRVQTGADGRWSLEVIPVAAGGLSARVLDSAGYAEAGFTVLDTDGVAKLRSGSHTFVLNQAMQLVGRVIDEQGRPVEGATVSRGLANGPQSGRPIDEVKSGANGEFSFASEVRQPAALAARAPGHAACSEAAFPGEGEVVLRLRRARMLRARVVDERGAALPNVRVACGDERTDLHAWSVLSDAAGRFEWAEAPRDRVSLSFAQSGVIMPETLSVTADGVEQVVTLKRAVRRALKGVATDAASGAALGQVRIVFAEPGGDPNRPRWRHRNPDVFETGAFEVLLPADPVITFRVEADGYQPQVVRLDASTDASAPLNLKLERSAGLHGTLVSPLGEPLAAIPVVLAPVSSTMPYDTLKRGSRDALVVETGPNGEFRFAAQTEVHRLCVEHDSGYFEALSSALTEGQEVRLIPWSRIEGVCLAGDDGGRGETIQCKPIEDGRQGPTSRREAQADAQGRFVFERMPSGRVELSRFVRVPRTQRSGSVRIENAIELDVPLGVTVSATLTEERVTVQGELVLAAESPRGLEQLDIRGWLRKLEPFPVNWSQMDSEQKQKWLAEFRKSPEGRRFGRIPTTQPCTIDGRGKFLAQDVYPGRYAAEFEAADRGQDAVQIPPTRHAIEVRPADADAAERVVQVGRIELGRSDPELVPRAARTKLTVEAEPENQAALWLVVVALGALAGAGALVVFSRHKRKRASA